MIIIVHCPPFYFEVAAKNLIHFFKFVKMIVGKITIFELDNL